MRYDSFRAHVGDAPAEGDDSAAGDSTIPLTWTSPATSSASSAAAPDEATIRCRHEGVCELPDRYPLACYKCQFRGNREPPQDPQRGRSRWTGSLSFIGHEDEDPTERVRADIPPRRIAECRAPRLTAVPGAHAGLDTREGRDPVRIQMRRPAVSVAAEVPVSSLVGLMEEQLETVLLSEEARVHERALCTRTSEIGRDGSRGTLRYQIVYAPGGPRLRALR
ncbi:MAG: hypothetical protein KC466_05660 [Myxococcales bacterium]|nr:hypothetical protein [Myxococcales bacterium]